MFKSDDCVNNEHGSCKGILNEKDSLTKFCNCRCHDRVNHLVRNAIALLNRSQLDNP